MKVTIHSLDKVIDSVLGQRFVYFKIISFDETRGFKLGVGLCRGITFSLNLSKKDSCSASALTLVY